MSPHTRKQLVVVGHGMVGHRFVQAAVERGLTETHDVVVVGEEARAAYDRVALTSFFEVGADALSLLPEGAYDDPRVRAAARHARSVGFDPETRTVLLDDGQVLVYDELVLATGAAPFVPPVPGHDLPGAFVYRTIEDLEAIRDAAATATRRRRRRRRAARARGRQGAARPRPGDARGRDGAAPDGGAGRRRRRRHPAPPRRGPRPHRPHRRDDDLGARRRPRARPRAPRRATRSTPTWSCSPPASARATHWPARPASTSPSAAACWSTSPCRTSDPHVWAIGECAAPGGRMYGLVAPGYAMAEVAVDALLGGDGAFTGADMSTKLKLMGVDVASFGDAFATTDGALELVYSDAVAGVYKKLVVSEDGTRLLGGVLVGDASAYGVLRPMVAPTAACRCRPTPRS